MVRELTTVFFDSDRQAQKAIDLIEWSNSFPLDQVQKAVDAIQDNRKFVAIAHLQEASTTLQRLLDITQS